MVLCSGGPERLSSHYVNGGAVHILGCPRLGDVGIIVPTPTSFSLPPTFNAGSKSSFPSHLCSLCVPQKTRLVHLRVAHLPSAPREADLCSSPEAWRCRQLLPMSHLLTNQPPCKDHQPLRRTGSDSFQGPSMLLLKLARRGHCC